MRVKETWLVTVWGTWRGVTALVTSRDLSGRSDRSRWGNHAKGVQTTSSCLFMSTRRFLPQGFRINREWSWIALSSTQAMYETPCMCEGGGPPVSACRGAPASTSRGRDPSPRRVVRVARGAAILGRVRNGGKLSSLHVSAWRKSDPRSCR